MLHRYSIATDNWHFIFIPGGDMATSACAYDPLFYPLHAYIDYLFAQWQRRNPDTEVSKGVIF